MAHEQQIARILNAFPQPAWPLNVSPATYDGDLDCEYVIAHCRGKNWTDLTHEELSHISSDSWALTRDAMLHFLPAFMTDDLKHDWDHLPKMQQHLELMAERIASEWTIEQVELLLYCFTSHYDYRSRFSPNRLFDALCSRLGRADERPVDDY